MVKVQRERRHTAKVDVTIDADVVAVWRGLTDWAGQSHWMLATTVTQDKGQSVGLGERFTATTGIRSFKFDDPMVVTHWDPPRRATVEHLGKVVRGEGGFEVFALPGGRSRVVWTERVRLPFGVIGGLSWPAAKLAFEVFARRSLMRFREVVESAAHAGQR